MPKVSDEYFEKKKKEILVAAYAVCMRKPLHEVSMRDIIAESGLSQGGIYRYFSSLADILIALIDKDSDKYDIVVMIDTVVSSDDIPERIIGKMFDIWEQTVIDNLVGMGKIFFESLIVYANNKDMLNRLLTESSMAVKENYLKEKGVSYIAQKVMEGYFKPKLPLENIIGFLSASFDGIIRDLILTQHYGFPSPPGFEKDRLIKSLCYAVVLLLGGDEKLIY